MRSRSLFALLGLVLVGCSLSSAQFTQAPQIADSPSDNLGLPIPLANLTICQNACIANHSCIGFSLGISSSYLQCISTPCCFLKQSLSTLVSNAGGTCSKGPCYSYAEDPINHRCSSDCQCDSTRTCSQWGYCSGSSTTCVASPPAAAPSTTLMTYLPPVGKKAV